MNIKRLYELFKNTKSHGLVSLPFFGLIQFYLEKDDRLIKNSLTELYGNLSYMTLSGATDFQFEAVSDLTAKLSFLLKQATINNTRVRELEHLATAKLINDERNFEPTIQGELDDLLEILDEPDIEHKKYMFPYKPPQLQTADEIETSSQLVDADFIDLQTEFDKVNDMTTAQKQQKRLEDTVEAVIDEKNPFTNVDNNFWWQDEFFDKRDSNETVEMSKSILNDALHSSQKNIRPVDDKTIEQLIDDDFISIDDRTQQELEDDDYIELKSADNVDIDLTAALGPKTNNSLYRLWKTKNKAIDRFQSKSASSKQNFKKASEKKNLQKKPAQK